MGKPVRVFSEEEIADIVARYAVGESRRSIARSYVTKPEKIHLVLLRQGVEILPSWPKKLSEEREAELVRRYDTGESLDDLIKVFGVSGTIVRRIVKRRGGTQRPRGQQPRRFTDEEFALMAEMSERGMSQYEIANHLDSRTYTVNAAMRQQGIPPAWRGAAKGEKHGSWKGGRIEVGDYISIRVWSDNPYFSMAQYNGYVLEHRLVMAEYLGRPLYTWETVHHIDSEKKRDNRIENLQLRIGRHGHSSAYRCMDCGSNRLEPVPLE